jgi:hypothetical protein
MAENEDTAPAAPRRKTLDELMQFAREKAAKATATAEQKAAEITRQLWLPGFDIGAMPNHINRSSLFAPVARGRRKFHRQTAMVTRSDCVLEYTGEQLDEADADLVMALIFFAQKQPLGTPVPLHRAQLLHKIGRATSGQHYDWLHRRIKALTEATLFLEAKKPDGSTRYAIGKTVSFRIVSSFVYDDETESYSYTLDPRWVQMFANHEYSLIDFERRLMIARGQDMAKALQRLVATSSDPVQRYALDWLKDKMSYDGRMRDFRESLMRACAELERLEIIARARIEQSTRGNSQLAVWLPASG